MTASGHRCCGTLLLVGCHSRQQQTDFIEYVYLAVSETNSAHWSTPKLQKRRNFLRF